jgi:hypothetical protein
LDLGASVPPDLAGDPTKDLVADLSERVAEDGAPAHAVKEIRRRSAAGEIPVGLHRLAEVLGEPEPERAARRGAQRPEQVVEVVRRYPCAVLDAADASVVAENLAAVLADGRRLVVTAGRPDLLAAVRDALPGPMRGLCVNGPLPLSDSELRELRTLLVTQTPSRRARLDEALPAPELVPTPARVAELCRAAGGKGYPARDGADLIPELLGQLRPARLAGLLETARRCRDALRGLDNDGTSSWARPLLERVLFGSDRTAFDGLLRKTADLVLAADSLRDVGDQMAVVGELPDGAVDQLRTYVDYLEHGGRARHYFRSAQQRAVAPVLRQLRLDGAPLRDPKVLRQALHFLELISYMEDVTARCRALRVPEPKNVPVAAALNRQLGLIEEAARASEMLRHEVLFIHPDSPVTVPDMVTTESVARAIVESGGSTAMTAAKNELVAVADALAGSAAAGGAVPEVEEVVAALRAMDLPEYEDALARLAAARREQADQVRLVRLLGRLREAAPELARSWADGSRRFTQGTARFVQLDDLLDDLPAADTADLVVLLDAQALGREHLLVSAAAPRLLAVATPFGPAPAHRLAVPAGETVLAALRGVEVPSVMVRDAAPAVPTQHGQHGQPRVPDGAPLPPAAVAPAPRTAPEHRMSPSPVAPPQPRPDWRTAPAAYAPPPPTARPETPAAYLPPARTEDPAAYLPPARPERPSAYVPPEQPMRRPEAYQPPARRAAEPERPEAYQPREEPVRPEVHQPPARPAQPEHEAHQLVEPEEYGLPEESAELSPGRVDEPAGSGERPEAARVADPAVAYRLPDEPGAHAAPESIGSGGASSDEPSAFEVSDDLAEPERSEAPAESGAFDVTGECAEPERYEDGLVEPERFEVSEEPAEPETVEAPDGRAEPERYEVSEDVAEPETFGESDELAESGRHGAAAESVELAGHGGPDAPAEPRTYAEPDAATRPGAGGQRGEEPVRDVQEPAAFDDRPRPQVPAQRAEEPDLESTTPVRAVAPNPTAAEPDTAGDHAPAGAAAGNATEGGTSDPAAGAAARADRDEARQPRPVAVPSQRTAPPREVVLPGKNSGDGDDEMEEVYEILPLGIVRVTKVAKAKASAAPRTDEEQDRAG